MSAAPLGQSAGVSMQPLLWASVVSSPLLVCSLSFVGSSFWGSCWRGALFLSRMGRVIFVSSSLDFCFRLPEFCLVLLSFVLGNSTYRKVLFR